MSLFQSKSVCVICNRRVPAAARRCPWCKKLLLSSAAGRTSSRMQERDARRLVLSLVGGGIGQ